MSGKKASGRPGCIVPGPNDSFMLTDIGLTHVLELAALGCSQTEIAEYLQVSRQWVQAILDEDGPKACPEAINAFRQGRAELSRRLRQAQLMLADTNAQMAIWLGKQHLNQRDQPIEVTKTVKIVGTLPDYKLTPEDWSRKFAPSLEPRKLVSEDAIDAEVVERED